MADDVLAAIDIGTNSFHLVVARVNDAGRMDVLEKVKEMVRLGSGAGDMKRLDPDAVERGIASLDRMRQVAEARQARVVAVATSAVREAENREEFIDRARNEAGVHVEVVSGFEEARLIHLGALQAVPVSDSRMLLCDIGGGSTEIVVGRGEQILASRSLRLGALRLTRRFFGGDSLHPGAVDACRRHVRSSITPFAAEVNKHGHDLAVGSSGTIEQVAKIVAAGRDDDPKTFNNYTFTRDDLEEVMKALVKAPTVAKREKIPGMEAKRADIILAGAIILEQVVDELDVGEITISEYALREGVLLDFAARIRGGARHHLHDVRRQSVLNLVDLMDEDPGHSFHVADLALQLFDETRDLHGLGDDAREWLEAGALLCNIGVAISHSGHHKHSYYVIRHSEHLTGFTDHEIEMIALVARYHRKSMPKSKHAEFAALGKDDQRAVRVLAGLLRVAIGLDRHHAGRVGTVRAQVADGDLVVEAVPRAGDDIDLELYAATARTDLLADTLDIGVTVTAPTPVARGDT